MLKLKETLMDPVTDLLYSVGKQLGFSPVAVGFGLLAISRVANAVTKAIPDTATGWRKYVRIGTKVVGLYVKDNTGVPSIPTTQGEIKQEVGDATHAAEEQGELLLDESLRPNVFQRGAAALNQESK